MCTSPTHPSGSMCEPQKTDQLGRGATVHLKASPHPKLCSVIDLKKFIDARPANHGPLLVHANGPCLSRGQFTAVLKKAIFMHSLLLMFLLCLHKIPGSVLLICLQALHWNCWSHSSLLIVFCSGAGRKKIWICGHGIMQWAQGHTSSTSWGAQFGLDDSTRITWLGQRGMHWLTSCFTVCGLPDVLVIQLGGNNLVGRKGINLTLSAASDQVVLHSVHSQMFILWFEMLAWQQWWDVMKPACIN